MNLKFMAALAVLVTSFAVAFYDVLYWLADDWELDGNYSHGWLVVPIAGYLAWERRSEVLRTPAAPSNWGLLLQACGILLLAAGTLAAETFLTRVSIVVCAVAAVWFVAGLRHVRILKFPLAFLLLMIPIPDIIFNRIAFPLQLVASDFGARSLALAGIPVFREGNMINLANLSLEVAEACSGIRSLITLFTLSLLYGYFFEQRSAIRIVLLIATIPTAILANGIRVAATGIAASFYGARAAEGFFHSFSGWIVFAVAAIALVAVRHVAVLIADRIAKPPAPQAVTAGELV